MEVIKPTQASEAVEASKTIGFQHLPAEVRCIVYTEMSPPLRYHMGHWYSMISTCKWLKAEAESEMVMYMQAYLERITKAWDETNTSPLQIKTPKTFQDIKNVNLSIPISILRNKYACCKIPRAFLPLLDLHLSSLTLTFHEDEPGMPMPNVLEMCDFIKTVSLLLLPNHNLPLDDGTVFFKQGLLDIDAVTVMWPHGFHDMDKAWFRSLHFISTRHVREIIESEVDEGVDGQVSLGPGKPLFRSKDLAKGVTWHRIAGKIRGCDGSMEVLYTRFLPYH